MSSVLPEDEFVHQDYPRGTTLPWKENWYFNFIDRERNAWGINHVSLERHTQQGRFSAFHIVDGETLLYANRIPLGDGFSILTDGALRVEIIVPHEKFRVIFAGPQHAIDLLYHARFEAFDYGPGDDGRLRGDERSLSINHYEQALTVGGTLTKNGKSRPISCFGHRDHSWGFRDESNIAGWNWAAVQFADKTINLSQVRIGGSKPLSRGFVSEPKGNTGIREVQVVSTERGADGIPVSSTFAVVDERGRAWTLTSRRFSGLVLPLIERGGGVVFYENFADYTLSEGSEKGVGIDEYLENPGSPS